MRDMIKMGYLKEKYLEGFSRETEVTLLKYQKHKQKKLTIEEEKQLDNLIDCQIEDIKIRRDEKEKGGRGIIG
jgi:hypothetical protein